MGFIRSPEEEYAVDFHSQEHKSILQALEFAMKHWHVSMREHIIRSMEQYADPPC